MCAADLVSMMMNGHPVVNAAQIPSTCALCKVNTLRGGEREGKVSQVVVPILRDVRERILHGFSVGVFLGPGTVHGRRGRGHGGRGGLGEPERGGETSLSACTQSQRRPIRPLVWLTSRGGFRVHNDVRMARRGGETSPEVDCVHHNA